MKYQNLLVAMLFCFATFSQNVMAFDVRELYQQCESDSHGEQMACVGFIGGYAAGTQLSQTVFDIKFEENSDKLLDICHPENGSITQGIAVFLKWAEANPERWHEGAELGLWQAFRGAFPCDTAE